MKPVEFKERNTTLHGAGTVKELPTYKGNDQIISCWQLTFFEKIKLIFTGKIWFIMRGYIHPPICLTVLKPFIVEKAPK